MTAKAASTDAPKPKPKRVPVKVGLLPVEAKMLQQLAKNASTGPSTALRAALRMAYKQTFNTNSAPRGG